MPRFKNSINSEAQGMNVYNDKNATIKVSRSGKDMQWDRRHIG